MRKMPLPSLSAAALVALSAYAPAVAAQETPAPAAAPTAPAPEVVAKARARADAILSKGQATKDFINITEGTLPQVQHKLSGLICVFLTDSEFSEVEILARNGAACTEKEKGVLSRIWLSPTLALLSPEEISKLQVSVKKNVHPDVQPYDGRIVTMEMAGLPRSYDGYTTFSDKNGRITGAVGNPVICRDSFARLRGWDVKITAYTQNKDAESGVYLATLSGFSWLAALQSVARKPAT